jgi:isopenicillin N synthase-like dioxygenase
MDDFYISCDKASFMILAALERSMEVHTGTFQDMCKPRNASEARINRYPAIPLSEMRSNDTTRISPHFDLGVITLLFADNIGGLEFQYRKDNRSDVFSPVEAGDQAEMIVSVAETMQRWTQDVLPASLHRVTIPADMKEQDEGIVPERFSIVYLAKADRKASVGVLPEFRSQGVEKYENMTALEYHMRRIATAY